MLSHPIILNNITASVAGPAMIVSPQGLIAALNPSFKARFRVKDQDLCGRHVPEIDEEIRWTESAAELQLSLPGVGVSVPVVAERLCVANRLVGYCVLIAEALDGYNGNGAEGSRLQTAMDTIPSGVTVWAPDGSLMIANEKIVELYKKYGIELRAGDRRPEVVQAALRAGLFGNKYRGLGQIGDRLLDRWTMDEFEHCGNRVIVPLSGQRWLKLTTHVLESGCVVSFYEDTGEPKSVEMQPANIALYFESVLRRLPDFVVHIGIDGRLEFVNDACAAALGLKPEDIIGRLGLRFFEDAFAGPMQQMIRELTPGSSTFSFDQRWKKAEDQFVWLRWNSQGLFENGQLVGIVATGRDISVEYAQQQALKHQSDELTKKNRSLEQFAAVVSHDLKAPLRHVSVFADMIVEEAGKGNLADVQTYAEQVRISSQRMDRIIRRLLEYSQIAYRIATISRVNLAEIAIQAIQNIERQVEESRAELLLSKLPEIDGDPDLLRHLLQNLIANAVKYTRKGATPRVRIYATETSSVANLIVEDNGIGIDPKFADRIFTAFQRLHTDDKVYEGFGVGLALCKQIAESHRGSIKLDTDFTRGARFVVRLPKALDP